ncbi:MAG: FGGY-family carbohydrate kinase [Acholeplasmataceae bacterium]
MDYLAIDLGASSGRIIVVSKTNDIMLNEIRRFQIQTIEIDNEHAILKLDELINNITLGIKEAFHQYPYIVSIGIDTWGVDYGYVDQDGYIENPYFYRSLRTKPVIHEVYDICSKNHLYQLTGIQNQYFNTIYQMYADKLSDKPYKNIKKALLLPDLIAYILTGEMRLELTNLSTTGLYNPIKRELIQDIDQLTFGKGKFAKIIYPTEVYGMLKASFGYPHIPVVAVCTHDTASAIVSLPLQDTDIYISSGSWSLLGILLKEPCINEQAQQLNFTNEVGFNHDIRFLKNINGLFIANHVMKLFKKRGKPLTFELIYQEVQKVQPFKSLIDVNHHIFDNPLNMIEAIQSYCLQTKQYVPKTIGEIFRTIYESLALKYAIEIEGIYKITQQVYQHIYIFGGGGQINFINQLLADLTSLEVIQGPKEATVLGNGIVQMLANKEITTISEGQKLIQKSFGKRVFKPMDINQTYIKKLYLEIVEKGEKNVNYRTISNGKRKV